MDRFTRGFSVLFAGNRVHPDTGHRIRRRNSENSESFVERGRRARSGGVRAAGGSDFPGRAGGHARFGESHQRRFQQRRHEPHLSRKLKRRVPPGRSRRTIPASGPESKRVSAAAPTMPIAIPAASHVAPPIPPPAMSRGPRHRIDTRLACFHLTRRGLASILVGFVLFGTLSILSGSGFKWLK